jgi:CBS domain-containing protein
MTVTNVRLIRVDKPEEALEEEYSGVITDSDIEDLKKLVRKGLLEVMRDRDSRRVVLAPAKAVEDFVDAVFGLRGHSA